MSIFEKYGFVKTEEFTGGWRYNGEYYFEIEKEEDLKTFMEDFNITLDDFDTSDFEYPEDEFCGLEFKVVICSDGKLLEFGPVFTNGLDYVTADLVACEIVGLLEHLAEKIGVEE